MGKLLAPAAVAALALISCKSGTSSDSPSPSGSGAGTGTSGTSTAGTGTSGTAASGTGTAGTGTAGTGTGSGSAASDPWSTPSTPKPPDTPEARKARGDAAVSRVVAIEPDVAKLRELAFTREVPAHFQPAAEFQAYVRREITKELPANRSRDISAAYTHLGIFAKSVDLAAIEEQAMVTQAGAYYDPAAKQFFLVAVPDSELFLDTMSAHELTHALQDQHFDLHKYLPDFGKLDQDAADARRFIVEGDATLVMLLYSVRQAISDRVPPAVLATLRSQVESFAHLSIADLKAQYKSQSALFPGLGSEIQKAIDAMDDIPPAVLVPLLDSYMGGALVALTAYEQGGWAAVDDLYKHPPESTEQVLHPSTKLLPVREHPRKLTLARPTDPELISGVLGELQWRIYFTLWKVPNPDDAASGWGGDHFSVTRRKDGHLVGRIATTWDDEPAATRFAAAYLASLSTRFPGLDTSHPDTGLTRPDGTKIFLRRTGTNVFILDGADSPSALDTLARTTKVD